MEGHYSIYQKIGLILGLTIFLIMLFSPSIGSMSREAYLTGAVAILMSIFWITEAIPIPATALIPLVLFPILKIQKASDVAVSYGDNIIYLFMGGFFIAEAMQKCNLHKRIALFIIKRLGTEKRRIVLGFMISTAFISLWISNTATALMMFPIAVAVTLSLEEIEKNGDKNVIMKKSNLGKALMLAVAYSASIGGIGTLIGTPPNLVFAAISKKLFPNSPAVGFAYWMMIGLPVVIIMIPISWYYLVSFGFKIKKEKFEKGSTIIDEKIKELGPMKLSEKFVLGIFSLTAFGWILRENIKIGSFIIPGWSNLLGINEFIQDSTVAMFSSVLLFLIPVNLRKKEFLLDWETAKNIPWGILILFGGGIALSSAFTVSGLSRWIGESLRYFSNFSPFWIIIIVSLAAIALTEVTSNTAAATIFMPIMGGLAVFLKVHPHILMIPVTISVSLAFMLPVSTPPNAVVFSSGYLEISDMVKAGAILDIIGCILITALLYFLIFPILGINPTVVPGWAI